MCQGRFTLLIDDAPLNGLSNTANDGNGQWHADVGQLYLYDQTYMWASVWSTAARQNCPGVTISEVDGRDLVE